MNSIVGEMDQALLTPAAQAHCVPPCSRCHLHALCLPAGLSRAELGRIDGRMVKLRRKLARGDSLFQCGDRFDAIYAVWTGQFKTCVMSKDGREQVTGFQMPGELVGLDGIAAGRHEVDAVALDDAQVCVIPFDGLEALALEITPLRRQLHRIMSSEIVLNNSVMLMLGGLSADERLATFLLNLLERQRARGSSGSSILLRMSREEIGSYLGLKIETVSRTFSKFRASGLLCVRYRQILVTDPPGLTMIVEGQRH